VLYEKSLPSRLDSFGLRGVNPCDVSLIFSLLSLLPVPSEHVTVFGREQCVPRSIESDDKYGISDNGIEHVATETANASLTSARRAQLIRGTGLRQRPICGCRARCIRREGGSWNSPWNRLICLTASNRAQFQFGTKHIGINYFPAFYQEPTNFMRATHAYAPRQLQLGLRLGF
jgi:hypothetical protein